MKITWIGHSCFKIESAGYSIILDPYADGSVPGLLPVRETANQVLCSHSHGDHGAIQCVELMKNKENPFQITALESYHDDKQGTLRGRNTIHILDDGTARIAHFGDLGCALSSEQIDQLTNLDLILLPVGGFYTIDAAQAREILTQLAPKTVIPMHYSGNVHGSAFGYDVLDKVSVFLDLCNNVELIADHTIDPAEHIGNIVVLEPKNI